MRVPNICRSMYRQSRFRAYRSSPSYRNMGYMISDGSIEIPTFLGFQAWEWVSSLIIIGVFSLVLLFGK